MQKSLLVKLLGIIVALVLSMSASAIGMGGIKVVSALGQPLQADIELVSVSKTEKTSVVARLASPDIYKGAGLEYPYGNKFKFQIESRANGEPYLKVGSSQPVNDPFVSLLVELTWSSGKLLREYTFLLDPPDYVAEQPAPMEVQAVAPTATPAPVEQPVEQTDAERRYQQEWVESTEQQPAAPEDEKPVTPAAADMPKEKPAVRVATGNITVKRGDTLTRIALQNKPAEVSLEQMLVALYRANAGQFDGKNMNRIRVGKVLRLPVQDELMSVTQPDATKEIRAHVADWNVYRQKLASAAAIASQTQDTQQVVTGKIASSVADQAPVAKEAAKEVLKLSKGEAPGDQAGAGPVGKAASAEDKKNAAREDAIATAKASQEEQARATLLENNLEDMQRLAKLKSEAAALAASAGVTASAVSAVVAASEVQPQPVAKPKPVVQPEPKVAAPEPSLFDQILGEPLYLIAGVAVLLGLGGLGFMLSRRKQTAVASVSEPDEFSGTVSGQHMAAPVVPSPDTGDFTGAVAKHVEADSQKDEVDPISEADLFLNFGRDTQAEEILKDALKNTPDNHQIHLKLLGIYANRKDANSFSSIARRLQDSGNEEVWQQAVAMGRKLEPNNPMYGGTATIEDAGSATMRAVSPGVTQGLGKAEAPEEEALSPEVDFDLGVQPQQPSAAAEHDFFADVDDTEETTNLTSSDMEAAHAAPMDFDVTSTHPPMPALAGQEEAALPNLDDLVFDVTSTSPSMPAATGQTEPDQPAEIGQADKGMEFTLDFPVKETAQESVPEAPEIGLAGISLNLDDGAAPGESVAESRDEHWQEVATKLDLAKAYQEMGDASGAREILEEVQREGDEGQREAAQAMLDQLG